MKYFMIVGDRSGDIQAARLVKEIRRNDIRAEIAGVGRDYMRNVDVKILSEYSSLTSPSIFNIIGRFKKIGSFRLLKKNLKDFNPELLILVGFSPLGMKIAAHAKKLAIKTCYFNPPRLLSNKKAIVKQFKNRIDKLLVTLPFEADHYRSKGLDVEYVGNPAIDSIKNYSYDPQFEVDPNQTTIAVLPGIKRKEIASTANLIKSLAKITPSYRFLIDGQKDVNIENYLPFRKMENVEIFFNRRYDIVKRSNVAIVTSGIATLETALLNCPQVLVKCFNPFWKLIEKRNGWGRWVSIVNRISQKEVVKEFVQRKPNANEVLKELNMILNDYHYCAGMMTDYQELLDKIGAEPASRKAGRIIVEWLEK